MLESGNAASTGKDVMVDNKLVLLYLIEKMDVPISSSQISQFLLEEELMTYFDMQQCLSDLMQSGLIAKDNDDTSTTYKVTAQGITTLDFFVKQIPIQTRTKINKHVSETQDAGKPNNYEVTANYFYVHDTNEFIVKCGVYDEETTLMEVNVSVVTKEQAKLICTSWKENVNKLYIKMINLLVKGDTESKQD